MEEFIPGGPGKPGGPPGPCMPCFPGGPGGPKRKIFIFNNSFQNTYQRVLEYPMSLDFLHLKIIISSLIEILFSSYLDN
jgi:hypothetical protein